MSANNGLFAILKSPDFTMLRGARNQVRKQYKEKCSLLKKAFSFCVINKNRLDELKKKLDDEFIRWDCKPVDLKIEEARYRANEIFFNDREFIAQLTSQGLAISQIYNKLSKLDPEFETKISKPLFSSIIEARIGKQRYQKVTAPYENEMRERLLKGETRYSISKDLSLRCKNISQTTFAQRLDTIHKELYPDSVFERSKPLSDEVIKRIKEMLKQENSVAEIVNTLCNEYELEYLKISTLEQRIREIRSVLFPNFKSKKKKKYDINLLEQKDRIKAWLDSGKSLNAIAIILSKELGASKVTLYAKLKVVESEITD